MVVVNAMLGEGWQVHVVPVDDRNRHDADTSCWCGPRIEDSLHGRPRLVVHNALDRREFDEEPPRPALVGGGT